jgi:hypothetical protein
MFVVVRAKSNVSPPHSKSHYRCQPDCKAILKRPNGVVITHLADVPRCHQPPLAWRGVEAEADYAKDPRYVTRRTHALVDGVIDGAIFGWLYNLLAARKAE